MTKIMIKVTRTLKGNVVRSFVLINDRVLPFDKNDEVNVYILSGVEYGITVYCHGDTGGSIEVGVVRSGGKVIEPLKILLDQDGDVEHASDRFTVA